MEDEDDAYDDRDGDEQDDEDDADEDDEGKGGGEEGEDYGRDLRVFERLPRGSLWALFGLQNSSVGGNPES